MIEQPPLLTAVLDSLGIEYTAHGALAQIVLQDIMEDSRAVTPGCVYVAIRGVEHDGHRFIDAATAAGASAVIAENSTGVPEHVPCAVVGDTRDVLARLTPFVLGLSAVQHRGALDLIGVTGTNGKSTTCGLVRDLLSACGHPCACIGTIAYDLVGCSRPAPWTTPPARELAECLLEAHGFGARHAVMEVSSHALDQRRTAGLRFKVGVFTNLTGDHLDYHQDTAHYLRSKKRLFDALPADGVAIVNADDPSTADMISDCAARVVRFGFTDDADTRASAIECGLDATRFQLDTERWSGRIEIPLIGRHNVANILAASCVAHAIGLTWDDIAAVAGRVGPVPGRLQPAHPCGHPYAVFVDYAHTDDALDNVLAALRPLTPQRLWCVFGCGGDRDRTKRPRMAAVSQRHADNIVITSDNPRTEDPQRIADDILTGFEDGKRRRITVELDRARAIELALAKAGPGDVVLIAGKGHEDYQIVGRERNHFDDVEAVHACLSARPNH